MKPRAEIVKELVQGQKFDLVVIGGGATGIGAALEAALRGYKTLLLEKHDFTGGTSSKSTKLVHGGVRYMAQGDLKMVREALKERGYLIKNAPHLVHDQPFIIPNYRWWEGAFYTIGLTFYDLLAGRFSLGKSTHLSKKSVLTSLPGISEKGLKGGVLYHDGQFDDSRLGMDLLHAFFDHGGLALNYCGVKGLLKNDEKISGVSAEDQITGDTLNIESKAVINATGVWVDEILEMDDPDHQKLIGPSQGIHLVLDKSFLPGSHALMIPKTSDGRVLFAVPWHNHLVVGTTDTPVEHTADDPVPLEEEIKFILDTASQYLKKEVTRKDVLSVFAGLRPLAAPKEGSSKTKEISRNHKIIVSEKKLITIIGGKWTTYRKMSEDLINTAIKQGLLSPSKSTSKDFKLSGSETGTNDKRFGIYGRNGISIQKLTEKDPRLAEQIHPLLPYSKAEVVWLCRTEMVVHLEDLMARRLRALFLNAGASIEISGDIALQIAPILGWDKQTVKREVQNFEVLALKYVLKE